MSTDPEADPGPAPGSTQPTLVQTSLPDNKRLKFDSPEVRLAHEIARQFAHEPDAEAIAHVADHINRFWAPAMIARLHEAAEVATGVDPFVTAVLRHLDESPTD